MGKSLYRSYRSKSFDEIIGQDHITTTLQNALKNNAISHAYLLAGPRGVGKTSVARILAYAVNGHKYDLESTNLDIIEIDAASNRRIDEIRDIREKVNIAPTSGKYKVYIIDEVHMLTKEAFNALLKTLEEPPDHAIFILATTETHKVPETIISRCIKFNFKPIETELLSSHLMMIAKSEGINLSEEAAKILAEHGRGSFRDAISLLDQVKHRAKKIQAEHVSEMLGLAPAELLQQIMSNVEAGDIKQLSDNLSKAFMSGSDVTILASQLQEYLRHQMLSGSSSLLSNEQVLSLQENLLLVPGSPKPRIALELCLSKHAIIMKNNPESGSQSHNSPRPVAPPTYNPKDDNEDRYSNISESTDISQNEIPGSSIMNDMEAPQDEVWGKLLAELRKTNNTLYAVAKMAKVTNKGDSLHLEFRFAFHEKRINESKNTALINKMLKEVSSGSVKEVSTSITQQAGNDQSLDDRLNIELQNVSNIFGAHEVLES